MLQAQRHSWHSCTRVACCKRQLSTCRNAIAFYRSNSRDYDADDTTVAPPLIFNDTNNSPELGVNPSFAASSHVESSELNVEKCKSKLPLSVKKKKIRTSCTKLSRRGLLNSSRAHHYHNHSQT